MATRKSTYGRLSKRAQPILVGAVAGLGVLLITCASDFTLYVRGQEALRSEVRGNLIRNAEMVSVLVDAELHSRFHSPAQESSPEYARAIAPLAKALKSAPDIKFIYTCVWNKGDVRFILDPTPPGDSDNDGVDDKSHIMQVYPDASSSLRDALILGHANADAEPYTDDWGTFISGFAPIHDRNGKVIAVVGIDLTADQYSARLAKMRYAAQAGAAIGLALSIVVGFLVAHLYKRSEMSQRELERLVVERTSELSNEISERKTTDETLRHVLAGARCLLWLARVIDTPTGLDWQLQIPGEDAAARWLPVTNDAQLEYRFAWRNAIPQEDRDAMDAHAESAIRSGRLFYQQEFRCVLADGSVRWLSEEVQIQSIGQDTWRLVGICTDVTERRDFESQLTHQAFHDTLTRLPNRALFANRLDHALEQSRRDKSVVAVLFLDLDNFKIINDSLGHEAGDHLLLSVAARLRSVVRPGDTVARLGGDEFVVLLEAIHEDEINRVAERLATALREPMSLGGHEVFTTGSIGIALATGGDATASELLRDADTAMYQAKTAGKARYAIFDPGMNVKAMERLEIEGALRNAVANQQLRVHYQPIVVLESGRIREVEALVRWEHPERGLIQPGTFITIAEESGLIREIGLWVLREACTQARIWNDEFGGSESDDLIVGVNLSLCQLQQSDLHQQVAQILCETGLPARCLKLEITESMMMQDPDTAIAQLHTLQALGVRLAMDDFGTGYSSMSYLSTLPLDTIKIDRSFISRLGDQVEDDAIVQAILALAKALNLRVTSEGIETEQHLARLQELGCDMGQGYLFSRALNSEAVSALLANDLNAAKHAKPQPKRTKKPLRRAA